MSILYATPLVCTTVLHVLTTATIDRLRERYPEQRPSGNSIRPARPIDSSRSPRRSRAIVEELGEPGGGEPQPEEKAQRFHGDRRAGTPWDISGVLSILRTGMIDPPLMDPAFAGIAVIPSWPRKRASIGTVRF